MVRPHLIAQVKAALAESQAAGDLPPLPEVSVTVEHPRQAEMGDYATNISLQLARLAKMPPQKIAELVSRHLSAPAVSAIFPASKQPEPAFTIEVVSGFINFRLTPACLACAIEEIIHQGEHWGCIDLGKGRKAQVEHGSANPTGYATVATGRNVVVGDTLANTLAAAGFQVHREWYVNDAGSQVRVFGQSVFARYAQALGRDEPMPEGGYLGDDVKEVGTLIATQEGERFLSMPREQAVRAIGRLGITLVMERIKRTMTRLNVRYDNFFSEKSLWTSGLGERMIDFLRARGLVIEHDGALWFSEDGSPIRSGQGQLKKEEDYAEAQDEAGRALPVQAVLIRSPRVIPDPEERPTYFASDIPYAWDKVMIRGFNPAIYVWGEDHQGDVPRLHAAARALGLPEGAIRIVIYRFITLMSGGQEVRMGKRKGNALLIDDLLDEIGPDAFRYIMLSRSIDTKFAFDLDVLKQQNDENPVYYIQYGHARICSLERKALEEGWAMAAPSDGLRYDHPAEHALIRKLMQLPEVIELVATTLQPHHSTTYAREVAGAFSKFYEDCRIKSAPPEVAYARLTLARATRLTLARTLNLMGMSAPDRM